MQPLGRRSGLAVLALVVAALATAILMRYSTLPREASFMAGIFLLAALWWVSEAVPPFATSLAVIALQILLLANPGGWRGLGFEDGQSPRYQSIVSSAADPVIMLFFGGFVLAQAAVKHAVDRVVAAALLRPFGTRPAMVLLGVMLITATFSMWMSNTATAAMMMAVTAPLLLAFPPGDGFRKALVLGVAFAANIGGMATPVGSPPNAVAIGFIRNAGYSIGFIQWIAIALPLAAGLLIFCWMLLWLRFRPGDAALDPGPPPPRLSRQGVFVVVVFALTVLSWLSEPWHGVPASAVALLSAVLLTVGGAVGRDDVNAIEWNILILIAGGISLGAGMQMTGLDQVVARALVGGAGWVALGAIVLVALLLGTFMSNTAAANLLLPIGMSLAAAPHAALSVVHVALSIALTSSLAMSLPISTPPNAIVYARGELTTRQMASVGAIIGLIGAAAIVLLGRHVMRFWGLGV